jgi:hypothetical protein
MQYESVPDTDEQMNVDVGDEGERRSELRNLRKKTEETSRTFHLVVALSAETLCAGRDSCIAAGAVRSFVVAGHQRGSNDLRRSPENFLISESNMKS